MTWILVVVLFYKGTDSVVIEFATQSECLQAGEQIKRENSYASPSFSCVKRSV